MTAETYEMSPETYFDDWMKLRRSSNAVQTFD